MNTSAKHPYRDPSELLRDVKDATRSSTQKIEDVVTDVRRFVMFDVGQRVPKSLLIELVLELERIQYAAAKDLTRERGRIVALAAAMTGLSGIVARVVQGATGTLIALLLVSMAAGALVGLSAIDEMTLLMTRLKESTAELSKYVGTLRVDERTGVRVGEEAARDGGEASEGASLDPQQARRNKAVTITGIKHIRQAIAVLLFVLTVAVVLLPLAISREHRLLLAWSLAMLTFVASPVDEWLSRAVWRFRRR